MVLVDTSVWVENLRNRREFLSLLQELPALNAVGHEELLLFVNGRRHPALDPGPETA